MASPPNLVAHKPHFHRNQAWKQPVRCATSTAGTLASDFENGDSAGGVTLATSDRILIKDQAAGAENGIYRVNASGAPTRDYDMDVAAEFVGAVVYVVAGTHAGTVWCCTNATEPTLGTTAITWAESPVPESLDFASILLTESDPPAAPAASKQRLYLNSSNLNAINSAGTIRVIGGGAAGGGIPETLLDAKGDLVVASAADTAARLAVGATTGHVLTVDPAETLGVKWAAAGGGSSRPYLDTYSAPLDATMGDDFEAASLDARWTRRTIAAGWESYQQGGGSWLVASIASATVACQYEQTCPAGDWEFIASFIVHRTHNSAMMYALMVKDSSGNGRGMCFYTDGLAYLGTIVSHAYSAFTAPAIGTGAYGFLAGQKVWARIRKSGTTIYVSFSGNGSIWSAERSVADSSTWATVAVGRIYGTQSADERFAIDLFDRVA